jgi:hypothetical protein
LCPEPVDPALTGYPQSAPPFPVQAVPGAIKQPLINSIIRHAGGSRDPVTFARRAAPGIGLILVGCNTDSGFACDATAGTPE